MLNEVSAVNRYTGDNSTVNFPYGFRIVDQADIEVSLDGAIQTLTTHYSVSGVGAAGGGTVTFVVAPGTGVRVTLLRTQPKAQSSDYAANEAFPSERVEQDFDKLAMIAQEHTELLSRTLRAPRQDALDMLLPSVASRASNVLGFTAAGLPTAVPLPTAGGGDLSLSTVLSTGSTTARTLAERFAEVINVTDYGAVGDGVSDDTTAIQAAIDAADAVGGTVFFPLGTYLISARLTINGTVQLIGAGWGSIIKVDSAAPRFLPILVQGDAFAAVNGVVMRDFKIDGSLKGQLDAGLIQFNNAINFLADHLWVTGGGTPGESATQGVNGISVSAGGLGNPGSQGTISNNLIEANTKAGVNWSTEAINGNIVGNIVRNGTGNTQTPGIQIFGGYNGRVAGNFVYGNQGPGIFMGTSGSAGTYRNTRYAIIEGNYTYQNGQGASTSYGSGIVLVNAATTTSQFGRVIITGNHAYGNGVNFNSYGIHIQNENNVLIDGNYVYNNTLSGILVEASTNVSVVNNLLESNNTVNSSNQAGVYLWAKSTAPLGSISVTNNKMYNGAAENQKYPVYYNNSTAESVSDITIADNVAAGHTTSDGFNFDYALPQRFYLRHRRTGQTTTNATATNIFYADLRDNSTAIVRVRTTAVKDDGSDRAMYDRSVLVYRDGGVATIQGTIQTAYEVESNASWDHTMDVTSNQVRGRITGVAATNITWDSLIEIQAE